MTSNAGMKTNTGAVAIYARYSTDRQDARSIDDQVRRCRPWRLRTATRSPPSMRMLRSPARTWIVSDCNAFSGMRGKVRFSCDRR